MGQTETVHHLDFIIGLFAMMDPLAAIPMLLAVTVGFSGAERRLTVLAAFVGISGSVEVGDGVAFGGRAGIADHVVIGSGASIGAGGTTFSDFRDLTGTNGNYGHAAWVYRRSGEPCRVCGSPIQRDKLSGRSSHWCPNCQGG